jgi:hypothetical protein
MIFRARIKPVTSRARKNFPVEHDIVSFSRDTHLDNIKMILRTYNFEDMDGIEVVWYVV